jgi:hypothetical protein
MGTKPKVPFAKTKSSDIESFSIAETLPLKDKGKLSFEMEDVKLPISLFISDISYY